MRELNNIKIIAVDHGYGNIKTANTVTPTGVTAYETEPIFSGNILEYGGIYYRIGESHKEFIADKAKPWQLCCYPEGRTYSPPIKWAVVSPLGSCALRGFAAPLEPYVQCHTFSNCCHCPRSYRKYNR